MHLEISDMNFPKMNLCLVACYRNDSKLGEKKTMYSKKLRMGL